VGICNDGFMNIVTSYVGLFGIIAILYGIRATLYHWMFNFRRIAVIVLSATVLAVPGVWFFSPDSKEEPQMFFGKWVFAPVCWLAVLCLSCLFDTLKRQRDLSRWYIRYPLEIFVMVPLWAFVWLWICIILNWVSVE